MPTSQENLLFKITVEQTGMTSPQIDSLTKSLQGLGNVLKGTGSGAGKNLQTTLEGIDVQAKNLISTMDKLNASFSRIGTGAAASNLNKVKSEVTQTNTAFISGGRAADSYAASMQRIGGPLNNVTSNLNRVVDQLGSYKNSATTANSANLTLTAGFEKLSTSGNIVRNSLATAGESAAIYGRQLDSAAAVTQQFGNANQRATSSIQQMTAANEQANTVQKQGVQFDSERANAMVQNIRHISGTALSFMSLYQAMDSVQGIGEMVSLQQEKVTAAQEKFNQAVAQFGPDSKQAIQAHDALAKAQRGLSYETREANFAMHNMLFMVGLVVIELTNSLLPIILKANNAMKEMGGIGGVAATGFQKLTQGITSSIPSFNMFTLGAGKSAKSAKTMAEEMVGSAPKIGYVGKGLEEVARTADAADPKLQHIGEKAVEVGGNALMGAAGAKELAKGATKAGEGAVEGATGVSLLARVGAVLLGGTVAVAAALAAAGVVAVLYGNNVLGARDAMNGLGVAMGKANPVLKLVGDGLVVVAGAMGLTGESSVRAQQHMSDLDKSYQTVATTWNNVVASMEASDNKVVQSIGHTMNIVGQSVVKMGNDLRNQVGLSIKTWGEFTAALEQHDYKKAVDIIGQAFGAIPGIIQKIAEDVTGLLINMGKGIISYFQAIKFDEMWTGLWQAIRGMDLELDKRIRAAVLGQANAVQQTIIQWVDQNITQPINKFAAGITAKATEIWDKIVKGAGSVVSTVTSWVTTYIVKPINKLADAISVTAADIWNKIETIGGSVVSVVGSWIDKNIAQPVNKLVDSISITAADIWNKISGGAVNIAQNVSSWATKNIADPINQVLGPIKTFIDSILQGLGSIKLPQLPSIPGLTSNPEQDTSSTGLTGNAAKDAEKVLGKQPETTGQNPLGGTSTNVPKMADNMHTFGDNPFGSQYGSDGPNLRGGQSPYGGGMSQQDFTNQSYADLMSKTEQAGAFVQGGGTGPGIGGGLSNISGNILDNVKPAQQQNMPGSMTPPKTDAAPKAETPEDIAKRNAAYKELGDSVAKLQTQYDGYNEILNNSTLSGDLEKKGALERKVAYQDMQAGLISATASNEEYSKQIQDGAILNTAFDQGIQDNITGLNDEQVALANSQGKHADMQSQLAKGIPQMISYNQGLDEQVGALQEQQRETAKTTGVNQQLMTQMADGSATTAAYNQGFAESVLALNQQQVAVSQTSGSLDAYDLAIKTGQVQTIAFGEGVNQVRKELIDKYTALQQTTGALLEYNNQLATGEPQAIAFMQGLMDEQMAAAKLQEEIANLQGHVQGLFDDLENGNTIFAEQTKAYYEGGKAAAEWGMQLLTADSGQKGLMDGLRQVGTALGVNTQGFVGNSDELKTWIGIMKGVGTVIDEVAGKMYEAGSQIISSLGDAIREGGKGMDDAMKDIEKKMGTDLPDGIKDAMKQAELQTVLADQLQMMLDTGMRVLETADPSAVAEFTNNMKDKWSEEMDAMSPQVQAKLTDVIKQIDNLFANQPAPGTDAFKVWGVTMKGLMDQVTAASDPTKKALDGIAGIKFSEQPISAWTTLIEKMKDNTPLTAAEEKMKAAATAAGLLGPAGTTAGTGLDTATTATGQLNTATTTANTTLTTFATTMGTMASVVQQVLANIVTQFQTTFTTITGVITTFFTTIVSMVAPNMALFVTQLAPIVPAWQLVFDTIIQATTVFFQTLTSMVAPNMVQFVAAAEPTIPGFQLIFDTITQNITQTFQTWVNMTQQNVQTITTEVQKLVGVYNDTFNRAIEDAAGYLLKLEQANAKIIQNITKEVQKIVGVFNDNFKRATDDAAGYVKKLGDFVAQVMQQIAQKAAQAAQGIDKIGQSAQKAAQEVGKLRSEIDSLHDKTVTITIRTVRVGAAAAAGMSPTLFMAGGGHVINEVYGDKPNNKNARVIVGESGDETVMRTGLQSKKTIVEDVHHIKYVKDLGANEPELLTVIPLEGMNAKRFREKHPEFYASGIYNAGSYPSYQPTLPAPIQQPTSYSKMLYGRITKDKHGNVTIGGRLVFRAGAPLDIDAYEGRHISHGSHGNPKDKKHFQVFDGSNEDIKHNGIPFTFGDLTDNKFMKGMTSGIGGTRGQPVTGAFGSTLNQTPAGPVDPDTIPPASTDRMQASERLYNDYISERVAAARDRPRTQQQDSVNGFVDNQGDPSQMEYNENALPDNQMNSVPPRLLPHHRQGPSAAQRSYEEDYTAFMQKLIGEITKKIDGKIRINLHSQVDTRIWGKITNQQVLNDMVRS